MNNILLPPPFNMVYEALRLQGWNAFSVVDKNKRNNWEPTKWFPGAAPFVIDESFSIEPLLLAIEGKCFGVFDATGFAFYDYNAIMQDATAERDMNAEQCAFYPFEDFNAYR